MNVPGLLPRILSLVYESILAVALIMVVAGIYYPLGALLPAALSGYGLWVSELTVLSGYFCWCWLRSGQTLAMKTWGIRLVAAGGGRPDLRSVLVRFVLALFGYFSAPLFLYSWRHHPWFLSLLLPGVLFLVLNWLWIFFDTERQMLQDRLAGTRLIKDS